MISIAILLAGEAIERQQYCPKSLLYLTLRDNDPRTVIMKNNNPSPYEGFSKLNREQRIEHLIRLGHLEQSEAEHFIAQKLLPFELADKMIENTIGYYHLPLGIAVNFVIDNHEYVIPMSVEETSIVAAASKTAKWIRTHGKIITETLGHLAIGQIQLAKVKNFPAFEAIINQNKKSLIEEANHRIAGSMTKRGGGVKEFVIRRISRKDGHEMAVVHVMVKTCDAMGANLINQICEYLKAPIQALTGETVNLCILSNLTDEKLTRATIIIDDIESNLGMAIQEASLFAYLDPYRAATNNKGVLNGMDAVAIATGNDWRALEAGIHAYAARKGNYSSITRWEMRDKQLIGVLEAPINIATVGGVTRIHPTAALCLKLLRVHSADKLARIIAAVGLVQNLGALRALSTEGIVHGHMRLHITNLCLAAGASAVEIEQLKPSLVQHLRTHKRITVNDVNDYLIQLRQSKQQ